MIIVTQSIQLHEDEVAYTAVKATGPGGQHVNATNSAVHLRFDAAKSPAIRPHIFTRLKAQAGRRMTNEGVIVLQAGDERSQHRSKAIVLERLCALIRSATVVQKARRKTKPTKGSVTRRLDSKSKKSSVKKGRGRVSRDD